MYDVRREDHRLPPNAPVSRGAEPHGLNLSLNLSLSPSLRPRVGQGSARGATTTSEWHHNPTMRSRLGMCYNPS
jgi:hypothetical protein